MRRAPSDGNRNDRVLLLGLTAHFRTSSIAGLRKLLSRPVVWFFLVVTCLLANLPLLTWMPFSNTTENLNIETAMEIRRTGSWLIPTLEAEPRVNKPPLPAWITAAVIRRSTLESISDTDAGIREEGFRRLAFEVRGIALLLACLTLICVYELGKTLGGRGIGLLAAIICASNFFFLHYSRTASIDLHLLLWVTLTQLCLVRAAMGRAPFVWSAAAGAAAGLAFMTKGPLALLFTLVPFLIHVIWARHRKPGEQATPSSRPWVGPGSVGCVAWALVSLPWFVLVLVRYGNQWNYWRKEVTGADDPGRVDSVFSYLWVTPLFFPWAVFLVVGIVQFSAAVLRRTRIPGVPRYSRLMMAFFALVIPLLVLQPFKDRRDGYILPLAGTASIVAAAGLRSFLRTGRSAPRLAGARGVAAFHWFLICGAAAGLPLAGAFGWAGLRTIDQHAWYGMPISIGAALAMLLLAAFGMRRFFNSSDYGRTLFPVVATALVAWIWNAIFVFGYSQSRGTQSDMKPLANAIWARYPDAEMYNPHPNSHKRFSVDLSIYLNRPTAWISPKSLGELQPGPHPKFAVVRGRDKAVSQKLQDQPAWKLFWQSSREENYWAYMLGPDKSADSMSSR